VEERLQAMGFSPRLEHSTSSIFRKPRAQSLFYRPMPMYWNPIARSRDESSRFLVSMMIGLFTRWRIFVKSSVRNSGQPVATTSASTPSATP